MEMDPDEGFLTSNAPEELKALFLRLRAIAQPYIDKMNADPLSDHHTLHAEVSAKIAAVTDEYNKRNLL